MQSTIIDGMIDYSTSNAADANEPPGRAEE